MAENAREKFRRAQKNVHRDSQKNHAQTALEPVGHASMFNASAAVSNRK
jgi:hypothetical protein